MCINQFDCKFVLNILIVYNYIMAEASEVTSTEF